MRNEVDIVTRTLGLEESRMWLTLSAICIISTAATAAAAQQTQPTQHTENVAAAANDPESDREFVVPIRVESTRPKGDVPGLDMLLQLPSGFVTEEPQIVAGVGETEWRRRFTTAERDLSEARASLENTKRELDEIAGSGGSSQWAISAPGGGGGEATPTNSPLSFKLRQQIREDRDRIVVGERAVRELRIEADLAGVPRRWRAVNPNSAESNKN